MVTADEYLTATGVPLRSIPGGRRAADEWDEPIAYLPAPVPVDDYYTLEQRLARAEENAEVWQDVARQLQDRCERMFTDIATLTGRSRSAVRSQYVPETSGAHLEPI